MAPRDSGPAAAPLSRSSLPVPGSGGNREATGRGQGGDREGVATAAPAEPPRRGPLAFVLVLNEFPLVSGSEQSGEPGKCRQPLTPAPPQPCPDCRRPARIVAALARIVARHLPHGRAGPLPRVPECAVPYGAGDIGEGGMSPCCPPFPSLGRDLGALVKPPPTLFRSLGQDLGVLVKISDPFSHPHERIWGVW